MKRGLTLLLLSTITGGKLYSQFTEVFWERRAVNDSLSMNVKTGLGQIIKVNDSTEIRLMSESVEWIEGQHTVIVHEEVSVDSPEAVYAINKVEVDSVGNYKHSTFLSLKGKISRELGTVYFKGTMTDYVMHYRLTAPPMDASESQLEKHREAIKNLDKKQYSMFVNETLMPIKYKFHTHNKVIRESAYVRMMFRWKGDIYTVYVPWNTK